MSRVIGRFYFKMTPTGNLIGEFSNNGMHEIDSECANKQSNEKGFIGIYHSVWEDDNGSNLAVLTIDYRAGTNDKIYVLKWKQNNITKFWGEGMLVDDLLIGDYRDFSKI